MSEVTLLKFEADWCGPCSMQSDILEDYDETPIETIDVDKQEEKAQEYMVRSLPTLVLEVDGEEEHRWNGVTEKDEITLRAIELKRNA